MSHLASIDLTLRTSDSWDPRFAIRAIHRIFISWKPLSLIYFKVNFDSSMMDSNRGAGFVIRGSDSRLVVVNSSGLLFRGQSYELLGLTSFV